ncbi:MAG: hypothetical protein ACREDT_14330 [Methylocella sp.]
MALETKPPRADLAAGVGGLSSCVLADDSPESNTPPAKWQQKSSASPAGRKFKLFTFDGYPVRGFLAADGTPWVIAIDIAAPLGVSLQRVQKFAKDIGGAEALILRSDAALKEGTFAYRFRTWICGEVIPSFRKDGTYEMTRQAKDLVQGMPGWGAARQQGIVARISFTDAIKAFVAAAEEAGSNNAEQYYRNFSELTRRVAKVDKKWHAGGRDALSPRDLNRLEQVEWFAADLIEEGLAKGIDYHAIFKGIEERFALIFHFAEDPA